MKKSIISHTWIINNFSRKKEGSSLSSQSFSSNSPLDATLLSHLKVYFKLQNETDGVYMNLFLSASEPITINAELEFAIIRAKPFGDKCNAIHVERIRKQFELVNLDGMLLLENGGRKLISDLLNPSRYCLNDDKLTIHCELHYSVDLCNTLASKSNAHLVNMVKDCESFALKDFHYLFKSGTLSDVVLVVGIGKGNKKNFAVHKAILAARSPVFAAMFEHDMKEKRDSRVHISYIAAEVFEELLHHIYSGKAIVLDYCSTELLAAADKYQLNLLRNVCEEVLCSNISDDALSLNAIVRLADRHNADKLKSKALEIVHKNTVQTVLDLIKEPEKLLQISEFIEQLNMSTQKEI